MKKTSKILFMVLVLILTLTFGVVNKAYADETADSDGYVDLNNVEPDDGETTNSTNQTTTTGNSTNQTENSVNGTNATGNISITNTTNGTNTTNTTNGVNATNTANPTNAATTDYPQTGEFINTKIIAIVSISAIAIIIAFAKIKKYNY